MIRHYINPFSPFNGAHFVTLANQPFRDVHCLSSPVSEWSCASDFAPIANRSWRSWNFEPLDSHPKLVQMWNGSILSYTFTENLAVPSLWYLTDWLVVWNMTSTVHSVGNNYIIPTDVHIFQRGWNHQPGRWPFWVPTHTDYLWSRACFLLENYEIFPSGDVNIALKNGHRNSEFSNYKDSDFPRVICLMS